MAKKKAVKKTVPKAAPKKAAREKVTCPRCKGDGIWHSGKTGIRAITSPEPNIDPERKCPKCKGAMKI